MLISKFIEGRIINNYIQHNIINNIFSILAALHNYEKASSSDLYNIIINTFIYRSVIILLFKKKFGIKYNIRFKRIMEFVESYDERFCFCVFAHACFCQNMMNTYRYLTYLDI